MNWLPSFLTFLFFSFLGNVSSEQAGFFYIIFGWACCTLYNHECNKQAVDKILSLSGVPSWSCLIVVTTTKLQTWTSFFSNICGDLFNSHHTICSPFICVTVSDTGRAVQAGGWSVGGLSAPSMRAREAAGLPKLNPAQEAQCWGSSSHPGKPPVWSQR